MPLHLTDAELATAAQACRAMAYQEGQQAKAMENPTTRGPLEAATRARCTRAPSRSSSFCGSCRPMRRPSLTKFVEAVVSGFTHGAEHSVDSAVKIAESWRRRQGDVSLRASPESYSPRGRGLQLAERRAAPSDLT